MQQPNLDDVARRSQKYWDVDGLPELMMGLLWMLWGGAWLLGDALPDDWRANAVWTTLPALLALSGVAAIWATKQLKQRLTFPRTGYVDWKEPSRSARLMAAGVAMVIAMVLVAVATNRDTRIEHAAAPLLGVILSLAFVVASVRQRAPHYLALAGVALVLALVFGALGAGWASVNWMFVALGAASAVLGGVRLVLFLRRHPLASLEGS
jgi:peptidoglycan/LPS O-acetylase OafA/YrhL